MEINIRADDGADVVTVSGSLDSSTSAALEAQLRDVISGGTGSVVVNLEDLEYMSSAGLRVMLIAAKSMKSANRKFILCSLQNAILEVFEVTGFLSIIDVADDYETAMVKAAG